MIEKISRQEWLNRNPQLRKVVAASPTGWMRAPEFSLWPNASEVQGIDDHQRSQLELALQGRVSILCGSPGTGKTYTVAKLIKAILNEGTATTDDIGIAAPTGKAAVRLTEMLSANGLDFRARTWHSLLGVKADSEIGGSSFLHDEQNPFSYRLLIGDESSMIDLSLMNSIFRARARGTHILLVGDTNQLPPVGRGAPLRDLIAAGLPCGELKEIKRNSGGIVEACAAIRDEKPWLHFTESDDANIQITEDKQDHKTERIINLIHSSASDGFDPVWDCQVLVALNESSVLSREVLNKRLQDELNPNPKHQGTKFRVKDKAVCLKNGFYKDATSKDELFVANGELAEVIAISSTDVVMKLENPSREISIPIQGKKSDDDADQPKGAIANWDLGYALSVHKSQGSEWPVVIVALDSYAGARLVCDRSWIYTSISRAKLKCYLVGESELAERFCRVQKITQRKTLLSELIKQQRFLRELESI